MSRKPSPFTNREKLNKLGPSAADVDLGLIVEQLVTTVNALVADKAALVAKLNADAGVTDTNYGAADTAVALATLESR